MTKKPQVLVIDDEASLRRVLGSSLIANGFGLIEADSGQAGLRQAAEAQPDCIVLDLGLPDMDGLELLRQLRSWSSVPVIVLTARGQEQEKITLLDAGADDYLTKPCAVGELMARIRVALRHRVAGAAEPALLQIGPLQLDLAGREVRRDGEPVHLTPLEFRLLAALVRNRGRVVTQRQLLEEVWGPEYIDAPHYLRIYMQHLRHKLEDDPARPRFLRTEPGVGYRLVVEP